MKARSTIIITGSIAISLLAAMLYSGNISNPVHENRIRVAFFANVGHAVPIIGLEKGFFRETLGDQVQIQSHVFDSGPQVIEAMFSNSIDLAYVGPGPALNGFLKTGGHGIKILAGAASGGSSLIVYDNSINSIDDFPGKKIAAPQIGNSQDVSLRTYIQQNGLKPAEKGGSVYIIDIQNPDIYTLFSKGDINAAWVPEPWASRLVLELNGTRLFNEKILWPEEKFSSVVLIARSDYIANNPDIINQWISVNTETVNWINKNPNETQSIFNDFLRKTMGKALRDDVLKESFSNIQFISDPLRESILTFAYNANDLGYFGRHGYDLDGLFYEHADSINLKEVLSENDKT